MPKEDLHQPRAFKGVMVSSTFTDLEDHRVALIEIIERRGLMPIPMEYDAALPAGDVIDASLAKVRDGHAYVGIIAKRYGQIPPCAQRNPRQVSITELEFDEAARLGRPILLFFMGKDHLVRESDIEADLTKKEKLKAFGERAKEKGPDNQVHRVYATFESLEDFKEKAAQSVDALHRHLDELDRPPAEPGGSFPEPAAAAPPTPDPIPDPPAFYAEPAYLGSHDFVGRRDQLETLNKWALPADSDPVLLFEAIGGTGKSMLTWEWVRHHAPAVRKDETKDAWAGRFWYSFYERGAIMADFCRHALAYMTGQPLRELEKKKTPELAPLLLHQLQSRPWLLVLDGLERVLVAYHRIDAAQLRDEEAGQSDAIARRDPCAAIRPEDDDLLRLLSTAAPSKLLLTSRLIPHVLLNSASQPIPGVLRERLPGLRPADAEALFRACQITGDPAAIQTYLKTHCDCHPLTIGALAGLVAHYLPARGNFDRWCAASDGGGRLDLANLNLVQKRNHILEASTSAASSDSRRVLSMIALLSEAVDFATLQALNPFLPPEIQEVSMAEKLKEALLRQDIFDEENEKAKQAALQHRAEYERARLQSAEFRAAADRLAQAIEDLEQRGLLQYDAQAGHYDLHPVVRAIAAAGLVSEEKETLGQRVVDYFSTRPHHPYEDAETLEDVRDGLRLVRILIQMRRFRDALYAFGGKLAMALSFNLEANAEVLSVLRAYFPNGWATLPKGRSLVEAAWLANFAGVTLRNIGESEAAIPAYGAALSATLELRDWQQARMCSTNISLVLSDQSRLAREQSWIRLALDLAEVTGLQEDQFRARLDQFVYQVKLGRYEEAEATWRILDPMGRNWPRHSYRLGFAEESYARFLFVRGSLTEEYLEYAESLAREGKDRSIIRVLVRLRGTLRLKRGEWALAAESLHEAAAMARVVGRSDAAAETQLALAKFRLGSLPEPSHEAARLAHLKESAHLALAELWLAIGDHDQAKKHALEAYRLAWADGAPYILYYELNEARGLLTQLGAEIPNLPPYDPAKDEKLPWEDAVRAALEALRAEKR